MRAMISLAAAQPIGCTGMRGRRTSDGSRRSASRDASVNGVSGSPGYGSVMSDPRWMYVPFAQPPSG